MDSDRSNDRVKALTQASKKKRQEALARTEQAIEKLVKNKQKITVRAIAKEAGVSVSYIYKYPELAYKVQTLRDAQKYSLDRHKKSDINISNSKKEKELHSNLLEEIEYLKTYIKTIESKKKSVSELQKEKSLLQLENEKLKQELEFTKQKLAETRDFILNKSQDNTQDNLELETRKRIVKKIT